MFGNAVYQSLDGGQTWSDRTPPRVSNGRMRDLLVTQTPDGYAVYHGSNLTLQVYESWTGAWRDHDPGLPYSKQVLEFAPFYPEGKLRIGTQGRGVWEGTLAHDIVPQALPMTARREVFCARDTVTLESHSILDQRDGATFAWAVSPAPAWISDANARRPQMLLDADGSYDVTLTVTDANGRTDTRTIADMTTLDSRCVLSDRAGMALALNGGHADVQGQAMRADSMTIMMWVRPGEPRYGTLMMARDASTPATSIHKWESNELGLHLADRGWYLGSGPFLDSAAWNHVAMTVAPDRVSLYLNGVEARMDVPVSTFDLSGGWRIGGDPGWADRSLVGDIEEVSVWNRPLSLEEIHHYRHHTLDPTRDNGLLHYFQFDVPELGVYDILGNAPQAPLLVTATTSSRTRRWVPARRLRSTTSLPIPGLPPVLPMRPCVRRIPSPCPSR